MCQLCGSDLTPAVLESIVFLDCAGCNQVETLPDYLPNVRILSIYNTNIDTVPSYPSLEAIYCFNTPLRSLPALPNLRKLLAQGSQLSAFPNDCYLLEQANVNDTQIETLPSSLISLEWLSAKRTRITRIPSTLVSLQWLNIKSTGLKELPSALPSLEYLNCGLTPIVRINIAGYKMLQTMYAQGCRMDPESIIEAGITYIG